MTKRMSRDKFTHCVNMPVDAVNAWDKAIMDAEEMIRESRQRISDLKRSIEMFKDLRESNAPFPGESAGREEAGA